jgi:hypothetical protein
LRVEFIRKTTWLPFKPVFLDYFVTGGNMITLKTLKVGVFVAVMGLTSSISHIAVALPLEAEVVNVEGVKIVIELHSHEHFAIGQEIEISYIAGGMEILIGSYRVTDMRERLVFAQVVNCNVPPSRGMDVLIYASEYPEPPASLQDSSVESQGR